MSTLKSTLLAFALLFSTMAWAQTDPAITSWLQNTTQKGSYYTQGSSTTVSNDILVNCQRVEYSSDFVYVTATGVPSYPTGPFMDGNPSNATNQNGIYKFPLVPKKNTGTPTATSGGNIGLFVNGVALFDFRDGVGWNSTTNTLCGGPGNPPCPGGMGSLTPWSRDAIPAEKAGFDCAKGHPAMGNYHHHQNPSAFKLDLNVISNVCNLYDADGLYAIDSNKHAPVLGYAYDGFPIYGAYAYKNADGTGGIVRIKSGYQLRNITKRSLAPDGTDVADGPDVSTTYPLGYFREDYEFVLHTGNDDYLDVHNGRFCITPEYPEGTYAYFATVDQNWNSAYPYVVGPTFYGVTANRKVTSVTESTTVYTAGSVTVFQPKLCELELNVFPNPVSDILVIQAFGVLRQDLSIKLFDLSGKMVQETTLPAGSTIRHLNTRLLYDGQYVLQISNGTETDIRRITVIR